MSKERRKEVAEAIEAVVTPSKIVALGFVDSRVVQQFNSEAEREKVWQAIPNADKIAHKLTFESAEEMEEWTKESPPTKRKRKTSIESNESK